MKLTADGNTLTQPLKVTMDPRAQVTASELNDQQRVGLAIFDEVREGRKALAEIGAVKKHLAELPAQSLAKRQETLAALTNLNAQIEKIERGDRANPRTITGLDAAVTGLSAALRVVEGSDRAIPSQAMDLYQEADRATKTGIADWSRVKGDQLTKLNQALQQSGLAPIQISQIEEQVEYWMTE